MSAASSYSLALSLRRHMLASGAVAVLLAAGVGGWAMASTLAGAVVAPGTFVVGSYVKAVQHPTGGVVGELLVTEGAYVEAGETVLRLDATQERAALAIVTKRLDELTARQARLVAERDGLPELRFPPELLARAQEPVAAEAMASEMRLFAIRREARDGNKAQLQERIAQLEHEVSGFGSQQEAFDRSLAILADEIAKLQGLYDQRLVSAQRLNSLEREAATVSADRAEAVAYQAQAAGRIAETRLQILQLEQDLRAEAGNELRDIDAQIGELVERRIAAEDKLARIELKAPQSGTVHQLAMHTVGGVVSPADKIMLIVPGNDELTVEARVNPSDIDQVALGQKALLRLSAFNQRTTPELNGEVDRVAADLSEDERTGQTYYLVRIRIPRAELSRLDGLGLVPGMPAEAFIQTGERTALSYFLKPLNDQITRAFRED